MSLVKELYEPYVLPARARISTDPVMRTLVDPAIDPAVLERFLIQQHSLGVYLTEPVEGWMRRAGQRGMTQGLEAFGRPFMSLAKQQAGQHLMLVEDLRNLVRRWNERRQPTLHVDRLLKQHPTDAMRAYRQLHEQTIGSDLPAGVLAMALEIENLTSVVGPHLLSNCARVLGPQSLEGLNTLKQRIQLETGATTRTAKMLEDLLAQNPDNARTLAELGAEALEAYLRFMADCLHSAEAALWTPAEAVA